MILSEDSRSSEKFMHGIRVLMAKNYIDNLSEEATKGLREKASQGIWPSMAPLGYLNCAREDGRRGVHDLGGRGIGVPGQRPPLGPEMRTRRAVLEDHLAHALSREAVEEVRDRFARMEPGFVVTRRERAATTCHYPVT